MVAPLIASTARVTTGGVKAASRSKGKARAQLKRPSAYGKIQERELERKSEAATQKQTPMQKGISLLAPELPQLSQFMQNFGSKISTVIKQVQATVAANEIFWVAIDFYIPQFVFWCVGIVALSITTVPVLDKLIPGNELYEASWMLITIIGVCSMIYAAIIFLAQKIDCFSGWKGFIFMCCFAAYFIFLIDLVPWFVVWIVAVVLLQDEQKEE